MNRKLISICIMLIMVAGLFALPPATAFAYPAEFEDGLDFEGISASATKDEIAEATGLNFTGSGTASVVTDGGTDKLSILSTANTGMSVYYPLSEAVTVGTLEVGLKMGSSGLASGAHHLLRHYNGTTLRALLEACDKWHYFPLKNGTPTRTETNSSPILNSATNMYHLRSVVSRASEDDDWTAVIYDDGGAEPAVLYSTTISRSTHPEITSVCLISTWAMAAKQTVTIDDVSVKYTEPRLMVTDISVPEGTISDKVKNIVVSFNSDIHPNTLSAVTLTKADDPSASITLDKSLAGNVLTLSFGTLEEGNYILTLGEGLSSEDGLVSVAPITYSYKVVDISKLNVDYGSTDFAEGSYNSTQMAAITPNLTYTSSGQYVIDDDGDGQALIITASGVYQGAGITWAPPEVVTAGIVSIDLEVKASDGGLMRNFFILYPEMGTQARTLQISSGASGFEKSTNGNAVDGTITSQPAKNADGYYELHFSASRITFGDSWNVELYDKLSDSETPIYSAVISADRLSSIQRILIADLYTMSALETAESLSIKSVFASVKEFPYVIWSDCEDIEPDAATLTLQLSKEIDEEKLEVRIAKSDDDTFTVNTEAEYDTDGCEITLTPESYLEYGTTYTVTFGDAGVTPYTFTTSGAPLRVKKADITYESESGTTTDIPSAGSFKAHCNVNIERSGNNSEVLLILVSYGETGTITKISTKTISSGETSGSTLIEDLTSETAKTVKCFVWEKTDSGYISVVR